MLVDCARQRAAPVWIAPVQPSPVHSCVPSELPAVYGESPAEKGSPAMSHASPNGRRATVPLMSHRLTRKLEALTLEALAHLEALADQLLAMGHRRPAAPRRIGAWNGRA